MWIVDRIEGTMAVVEVNGTFVDIPLLGLPAGVKEGDRLEIHLLPREEIAEPSAAGEGAAFGVVTGAGDEGDLGE